MKRLGIGYDHKYGRVEGRRTTEDIPDPGYRRLGSRAASEGSSAKELILRGVEQVLRKRRRKSRRRVKLPIVRSKRPGALRLDNAKIYGIIFSPDINVSITLMYQRLIHHLITRKWFEGQGPTSRVFVCRFTQLGLFRRLTSEVVVGRKELLTQEQAWRAYDRWLLGDSEETQAIAWRAVGLSGLVTSNGEPFSQRHRTQAS